jgi:hypothetical protein
VFLQPIDDADVRQAERSTALQNQADFRLIPRGWGFLCQA